MSSYQQPRKHRHKRHYTISIISGDSDGSSKRIHIGHVKTQIIAFAVFLFLLAVICYAIYSSIVIRNNKTLGLVQADRINTLSSENAALLASNTELESEIDQLSVALNQKVQEDESAAQEAEAASVPKGFPVSTSATYKLKYDDPNASADDSAEATSETGNPILVFTAEKGSQIVATGDGTVSTITADPIYGNCVTIDHGNGYVSIYRNAGDSLVKEGASVSSGSPLFVVADKNTKLGYQIQQDDTYVDPETVIEING